MKGVAISPLVAVVIVLVGIAYTVYVFEQDSGLASGITKEGEIKKAIAQMDKDLDKIPGIADDVLIENQHEFKDDPYIENEIASKIQSQLGFRPTVKITGGDWASTQIRITVPHYSVSVGDTTTTVDNLTRSYSLEAPRPHELFELYNGFDSGEVCTGYVDSNICSDVGKCNPHKKGNKTVWDPFYETTRKLLETEYEEHIHSEYNLGRVQAILETSGKTWCFNEACNVCPDCKVDFTFRLRIRDPSNLFIDFYLPDKSGNDRFHCSKGTNSP